MKLDTKVYIIAAVIIIAALMTGIVAAYQYIDSKKTELENLTLQKDLLNAQKEINTLQKQTIKEILGDGFPIITIKPWGENYVFVIDNSTEYLLTINEIVFENNKELIKHLQPGNGFFRISSNNYKKSVNIFTDISVLPKNSTATKYTVKNSGEHFVSIKTKAKNIITIQYSIIRTENGNPFHAFKIYQRTENNYKLLFENNHELTLDIWERNFPFLKDVKINDLLK